ncbi:MAG: isopenicillin N synthase family oxygenase [Gammaproteobacteria bacterium]|nr:isopenicillin N synthase family oxygenase [Gammaproteobacteria bacterium]
MGACVHEPDHHVVSPAANITRLRQDSSLIGEDASVSTSALPIVDIAPLRRNSRADIASVARQLGEAAEGSGFIYIAGHGVSPNLQESVYRQAAEWFALTEEEKLEHYIGNSAHHRGYVPCSERGDYADEGDARTYEAFDLSLDLAPDDPDIGPDKPLLGPNVWPDQPGFKQTVGAYYDQMAELGRILTSAFELYLGVAPGAMRNRMDKPTSQLRLLHYLPTPQARSSRPPSWSAELAAALSGSRSTRSGSLMTGDTPVNMGAHTDYECFTLLHQRNPGLQVLNNDNQWMLAPPVDGTYVINIGDMLETWTNGRFRATVHRVVSQGEERMSMPFFVAADYDAVVQPLPELVPRGEQPRYPALVAGHHLMGQLLRDFPYLRRRHERGELKLPFEIPDGNPFEQRRLAAHAAGASTVSTASSAIAA